MDRAEKLGLGVAIAGHVVLFGLLSLGFLAPPKPVPHQQASVEVSLVKDVGLEATAPQDVTSPAESVAPDQGAPEDAAPPAPQDPTPAPKPDPVPPQPQPKPAPPEPVRQTKPVPAAKPVAKPVPAPPRPAAPEKTAAKPAPAKTQSAAASSAKAKPAATKGTGTKETATATRPRGSRLGANFLEGLSDKPSTSVSAAPKAAKIGAQALADIGSAIKRQVQPCADRQPLPGPGAERIRVTVNLRLNRDGSLAARPRITAHDGVDDENGRYVARVDDLAIATFTGCSPLRGLPDDLYDVQNGWSNFSLRYKLPG